MKNEISVKIDNSALEETIEKANRLVELLRQVQQIVDSLHRTKKSET